MKAQLYKLSHSEDSLERALPGQFVFLGNHSDTISGFLASVDSFGMVFCLFEAVDSSLLPADAAIFKEQMTWGEILTELENALELNPAMRPFWMEAVNGEQDDQD